MNEKMTAQTPKEEREEVLKEIRQLENRKKILENNTPKEEFFKERTKRLKKYFKAFLDKKLEDEKFSVIF